MMINLGRMEYIILSNQANYLISYLHRSVLIIFIAENMHSTEIHQWAMEAQ